MSYRPEVIHVWICDGRSARYCYRTAESEYEGPPWGWVVTDEGDLCPACATERKAR